MTSDFSCLGSITIRSSIANATPIPETSCLVYFPYCFFISQLTHKLEFTIEECQDDAHLFTKALSREARTGTTTFIGNTLPTDRTNPRQGNGDRRRGEEPAHQVYRAREELRHEVQGQSPHEMPHQAPEVQCLGQGICIREGLGQVRGHAQRRPRHQMPRPQRSPPYVWEPSLSSLPLRSGCTADLPSVTAKLLASILCTHRGLVFCYGLLYPRKS